MYRLNGVSVVLLVSVDCGLGLKKQLGIALRATARGQDNNAAGRRQQTNRQFLVYMRDEDLCFR